MVTDINYNYQRQSDSAHASSTATGSSSASLSAQPAKKPRTSSSTLFDEYNASDDDVRQPGAGQTSQSLTLQINKYLGMDYHYSEDSLAF